jgi:signal transduction histidine kinase
LRGTEFDLCELVKDCLERIRPQFVSAGYAEPTLSACEQAVGQWDRMRIEQVLNNLLANALRYGRKKPIQVVIKQVEEDVILSVIDQGIGIAPEAQTKIFNRFERAVDASEVSGLGLGLFISRQIAEAHGGSITVQSELGKGSVFVVNLPKKMPRVQVLTMEVNHVE